MNTKEFFEALRVMESEKGIPAEFIAEKISTAIVTAVKKEYGGREIVFCDIDCEKHKFFLLYYRFFIRAASFSRDRPMRVTKTAATMASGMPEAVMVVMTRPKTADRATFLAAAYCSASNT